MTTPNAEERMIAACGLVCSECPAWLATKANDTARIAEIAEIWSREYNADITPDTVWCDGCFVEGRKCGHCAECPVRTCAVSRSLPNCGACAEWQTCPTLSEFFRIVPHARDIIASVARDA